MISIIFAINTNKGNADRNNIMLILNVDLFFSLVILSQAANAVTADNMEKTNV